MGMRSLSKSEFTPCHLALFCLGVSEFPFQAEPRQFPSPLFFLHLPSISHLSISHLPFFLRFPYRCFFNVGKLQTVNPSFNSYNHIAFPPQLPVTQDPDGENVNGDLTRRLLDAVKVVSERSKTESLPAWKVIQKSLETCISINENGFINKARLTKAFRDLQPDHALILYIVEQNACVLIRQSE